MPRCVFKMICLRSIRAQSQQAKVMRYANDSRACFYSSFGKQVNLEKHDAYRLYNTALFFARKKLDRFPLLPEVNLFNLRLKVKNTLFCTLFRDSFVKYRRSNVTKPVTKYNYYYFFRYSHCILRRYYFCTLLKTPSELPLREYSVSSLSISETTAKSLRVLLTLGFTRLITTSRTLLICPSLGRLCHYCQIKPRQSPRLS